jgi:hypothetical protein
MSIDHDILSQLLAAKIREQRLLGLACRIIRHDYTQGMVRKGTARQHQQVPPHKSLFHTPPGKGLPIGNLNAQFFANGHQDELDQFVKHAFRPHSYLRYAVRWIKRPERLCHDGVDENTTFPPGKVRLRRKSSA